MKKESNSPFDEYTKLVYQDSILPIMESRQAMMIDDSTDLGREINLIKTPGHSPGHYCLEINSNDRKGMLTGIFFIIRFRLLVHLYRQFSVMTKIYPIRLE